MAYEVPPLPYDYGALEPHIDEQTMRIHHDKHHQAYVDKANAALEGTEWADADVDEVLRSLGDLPEDIRTAVRNNAGGHSNHSFFWQIMGPDGGGEPGGDLGAAIDDAFGSFDAFKDEFKAAGIGRFGSGWAWLVHDGSGSRSSRRPTRTRPSATARRRCWASTSGSTPTTSSTRTAPRLHRRVLERRQLGRGREQARVCGRVARRRQPRAPGRAAMIATGPG